MVAMCRHQPSHDTLVLFCMRYRISIGAMDRAGRGGGLLIMLSSLRDVQYPTSRHPFLHLPG